MDSSSSTSIEQGWEQVVEVVGGQKLSGEVTISGAKNSALVIMGGTLLCGDGCRLTNVPDLVDTKRMLSILSALGVQINPIDKNTFEFDTKHIAQATAPYELVSKLRASFFVIGPMLARMGTARVPLPGGCAIGARPVELHVRGLQALGAHVTIQHGIVDAHVTGRSGRLQGGKIYLDYPSVGATETIMMAATLAEGETVIENAAQEPEVVDLANFCRAMGARIKGAGTNTITIEGVEKLHSTEYGIIPDRVEAGTFLTAAAITRSSITINEIIPDHLAPVIAKLEEIGVTITSDGERRLSTKINRTLKGTDIETLPYPGFPTDMQAQMMAVLCTCEGNSVVTETVFENRLRHVPELKRMGADVRVKGNNAIIQGVHRLSGAPVMSTDLRASAALIVAGLSADGTTIVRGLEHLDRGYEQIEQKLIQLGANIKRTTRKVD